MAKQVVDLKNIMSLMNQDSDSSGVDGKDIPVVKAGGHRGKKLVRPTEEVLLRSLAIESKEIKKTQKDPTDNLVYLSTKDAINHVVINDTGYIIKCNDTGELWYAESKLCLDQNFIYREDLVIKEVNPDSFMEVYNELAVDFKEGIQPRKTCYILDIPANETYEVYYASNYPMEHYGKSCPSGMFILKFENRFHRDMAILNLDILYSDSSKRAAKNLTKKKLKPDEAIIVTDGAWMKDVQTSAMYYIDNTSVIHLVEGRAPEDKDQAVLLSEVYGATIALQTCYLRKKKNISYYYDNTSILNVFNNKKTEFLETVREYKKLLDKMFKEGFNVTFYELHPKSDEDKDNLNKSLVFFHNGCDRACRDMSDICRKDYSSYITETDSKKSYYEVDKNRKDKGNTNNRGGYKGNRRY